MTMHKIDNDVQAILNGLTLEEKVRLLSGTPNDFVSIAGLPEKGIPHLKTADSISGIRPSGFSDSLSTACFPNTACIASTWNTSLLETLGGELTRQARLKHAQMILGPTINIQRDPRAGRNFECFSEDPLLSGYLGAAIVNGIQGQGFGACAKHFVCNDSETMRRYYDVKESPYGRTLREVYLKAWEYLLRRSSPAGIMTAYNKVDGTFCCDSTVLIEDILRKEWGYDGIVMSDWFGTRSTVPAMIAGVDMEMPMPVFRGKKLIDAVTAGQISEQQIDTSVARLLKLRQKVQKAQSEGEEKSEIIKETCDVARQLAHEGIVLLKNENSALPLQASKELKVAVIGEYAKNAVFTGGGSASCTPQYRPAPIDLLREALPNPSNVLYAPGVRTRRIIPVVSPSITSTKQGSKGVEISYFNASCTSPFLVETSSDASLNLMGKQPSGLQLPGSHIEMSTTLVPTSTGSHTLALRHSGAFTLSVNGAEVLKGSAPDITTEQFLFNLIKLESRIDLPMESGESYDIHISMQAREPVVGEPTPYGLTLCFEEQYSEEEAISSAVQIAKTSDISIIYAGRSEQFESEGFDLEDITLPDNQIQMIKRVAASSKKTVVLLHCGNPVDVSAFISDIDGLVNMHFAGQEGPQAMIDILTGKVNPSGRLTCTWFKTLEDWPSAKYFPAKPTDKGEFEIAYAEGLKIGYRAVDEDEAGEKVQFPFGHGLSYTTFSYDDLTVSLDTSNFSSFPILNLSVRVSNTGPLAGKEVIQIYISPPQPGESAAWRPARQLKEFTKISLESGESKEVRMTLEDSTVFGYWSEGKRTWVLGKGVYGVEVGGQKEEVEVV